MILTFSYSFVIRDFHAITGNWCRRLLAVEGFNSEKIRLEAGVRDMRTSSIASLISSPFAAGIFSLAFPKDSAGANVRNMIQL
jgi:hypothetical protein